MKITVRLQTRKTNALVGQINCVTVDKGLERAFNKLLKFDLAAGLYEGKSDVPYQVGTKLSWKIRKEDYKRVAKKSEGKKFRLDSEGKPLVNDVPRFVDWLVASLAVAKRNDLGKIEVLVRIDEVPGSIEHLSAQVEALESEVSQLEAQAAAL